MNWIHRTQSSCAPLSAEERTKALFKRRKPLRSTRALVSKEEDKITIKLIFIFPQLFSPLPSLLFPRRILCTSMATLQKGNKKINASCQVFSNEIRVVKAKTDEVRAWCIIVIPFHTSRSFFSLSPNIPLLTSFTCFAAPSSKAVNQALLFRGHLCSTRVRFYRSPVPLFAPYVAGGWGRWRPEGMRKAILYFHLSNREGGVSLLLQEKAFFCQRRVNMIQILLTHSFGTSCAWRLTSGSNSTS